MGIEKVILKVTLKGVNNQCEEGEVLVPPLPQEILEEIEMGSKAIKVIYNNNVDADKVLDLPLSTTQIRTNSTLKREEGNRVKRVRRV